MTNTVKISFCFPRSAIKTKKIFIDALIRDIYLDKKIGYAGYSHKKYLRGALLRRFGNSSIKGYKPLSGAGKKQVEGLVRATIQKCFKKLSPLAAPIFVFIFPWFPQKGDEVFGGVNGFAPYMSTIHLFVSPKNFSAVSLQETIAHELNHAVYFRYHPVKQTLLESIVIEGLAENFREEVMGGAPAPWSVALNTKKSREVLALLGPSLKKYNLYREVFWNGRKYKRWTGYAIGYRIVRSFRKENPTLTWGEIMQMKPQEIFAQSKFIK